MRSLGYIILGAILASALACDSGRKAATGFRLPEGDVERGKAAMLDLKCHACHEVVGSGFPEPIADPPVPVRLGGETPYVRTDGQFVSSIVNPSHQLSYGFQKELVESGDESRMADYNEVMTVEQLIDMVAYLQSIYEVKPPPPMH